jgi:DNA repair protein RecN (Recombination protein N)
MLLELRIQNLAVIEELALEFAPGFNVLTGETGAGKSIILGALNLVLGGRGSPEIIRAGAESARVEAAFDAPVPEPTRELLSRYGVDVDDREPVVVSRQLTANGRSRVYINGQFATTTLLKALGDVWVDIHGQHEHQSLFRVETHLELLDAYSQVGEARAALAVAYERVQSARSRLRALQIEQQNTLREREYLEHELAELNRAALKEGEDESLEAERKRLQNAQALSRVSNGLFGRLYEAPGSALEQLQACRTQLGALRQLDESFKELESRLDTLYYELEDVSLFVRDYRDRLDFDAARLEEVEARLSLIYEMKRKYGLTISDVLARQRATQERHDSLKTRSDEMERLKEALRGDLREAGRIAFALSDRRREVARLLEERVEGELQGLAMTKTRFRVSVEPLESETGLLRRHDKGYNLTGTGVDRVEFLIAPNVGEPLRPLTKVASGGEISRVMLALKTVLADVDTVSTLVFDEIDSGIGGETATVVGRKLQALGRSRQVLCVTHLPQIAALSDAHFHVAKEVDGAGDDARTVATARRLASEERVAELARMLGGDSETSRAHARELLAFRVA